MKIAILGGSFNPLHIAHCMLAETVVKELHYDKVLFIPLAFPPHKIIKNDVSPEVRLEMVEKFCESEDAFEVDDFEVKKGGTSYTYDTVLYVLKKYDGVLEGKPGLILGQESALQFYKWHKADEIAKMCDLIVARRVMFDNFVDTAEYANTPTGEYEKDFTNCEFDKNFHFPYMMLENPVLPISSTEIRSRISNEKAFRYLVPETVYRYIEEHKLYRL